MPYWGTRAWVVVAAGNCWLAMWSITLQAEPTSICTSSKQKRKLEGRESQKGHNGLINADCNVNLRPYGKGQLQLTSTLCHSYDNVTTCPWDMCTHSTAEELLSNNRTFLSLCKLETRQSLESLLLAIAASNAIF